MLLFCSIAPQHPNWSGFELFRIEVGVCDGAPWQGSEIDR